MAWAGTPVWRTVEAVPHQRPLWARTTQLSIPEFSVRWRGYLAVPATTTYRFIARGKPAVLLIDGRPAADGDSPFAGPPLRLNRGLHPIQIDFAYAHGRQDFRIAWATKDGPFVPLDRMLLAPEIIPGDVVRHRRLLHVTGRMMPLLLLACVVAGVTTIVAGAIRRVFPPLPASRSSRVVLRLVLLAAAVLFAAGSWWGQPAFVDWAPDEISPNDVLDAVRMRFVGGWASIYPPLQFAVLALFDAPFFFTGAIGLPSVDDVRVRGMVVVVNRLVSSAMAVGLLFFIYRAAAEHSRPRAGIAAAAFAAGILPFAYYAKTSNVDVPYHFWLALALVFVLRAIRAGRPPDYYAFTVAGMAAVCTKDQAYGYLVLPALAIAWRAFAPGRSDVEPRPRTVLTMAGLVVASVLVFHLAPLNPQGFVEHFRLITGPASQPFRTYAQTLAGQAAMARDAVWQLGPMLSWPVFAIAAAAVAWAAWRRDRALLMLLIPLVSYYLTFIAVIGYHYDRFFIGVALILCIFAGWAVDRVVPDSGPRRGAILAAACGVMAFALWRAASLDALMIRDSRYAAEAWLRDTVGPGKTVAATGMSQYLPRHVKVGWDPIPASLESLRAHERMPDYIVLSAGFALREPDGSIGAEFYRALREGRDGYTLKKVFRTSLRFSPLALEARFREVRDDPQSNLSKINPAIEIYGR